MPSTFGTAPARMLSASCFQPSAVVGGVLQPERSGCAMICCSSGLTVLGTGMVFAGTSRDASGVVWAKTPLLAHKQAAAIAAMRKILSVMVSPNPSLLFGVAMMPIRTRLCTSHDSDGR